jgi:hypothetical protein
VPRMVCMGQAKFASRTGSRVKVARRERRLSPSRGTYWIFFGLSIGESTAIEPLRPAVAQLYCTATSQARPAGRPPPARSSGPHLRLGVTAESESGSTAGSCTVPTHMTLTPNHSSQVSLGLDSG